MRQIIKRPLVTEKNTNHQAEGSFAFEVDKTATKTDIRKAVEKAFDVKVVGVRTTVCRDRSRRVGMKFSKVRYWKKAFVKLAPGEKITLFEGV